MSLIKFIRKAHGIIQEMNYASRRMIEVMAIGPTCARSVPKPKIRDSTCWTRGRDWNGPIPGGQPGRPIRATHLGQRLKDLGIQPGQARSTALFQLATELPAALLARMLGIHIDVAVAWQRASAGDWMTYAADVSHRQMKDIPGA